MGALQKNGPKDGPFFWRSLSRATGRPTSNGQDIEHGGVTPTRLTRGFGAHDEPLFL
jgi:hypothetical protein